MRFWIIVGALSAIIISVSIFAFTRHRAYEAEQAAHAQTQQQLNTALANQQRAEATVNIFRTSQAVNQGTLFNPALVEVVPIPESLMNDRYVTNPAHLQGAIWRIPVAERGIITYDMLVFEPLHPTDRIHVVMVDSHTPSLLVGSYVDIRMLTPEGIDFVVLPKMRVVNLYTSGLEMRLSETQWMIYLGALIDRAMNPGTILYASMYVDPGLQPALYATYVPPRHIVEFMNVNRNMLFPYVDGTDIVEIRAFIESTFPLNLTRHLEFNTPEQAIRARANSIIGAIQSQSAATNLARTEFVAYMQLLYMQQGEEWQGGGVGLTQMEHPNVQAGVTGQADLNRQGQVQPRGTWIDGQGVERNPDGSPVIQITDLFNPGVQHEQEQAEIQTNQGWEINIPNLGGGR